MNALLAIGAWFTNQGNLSDTVFLSVTKQALADWRRARALSAATSAPAPAPVPVPTSTRSPYALSPADEFKKSIKRDPSAFKPFSNYKQWNPWHCSFRVIAHAQGLADVLDATYVPSTGDQQALFGVLQQYTFAVFTNTLKEPSATNLLCRYTGKLAGTNEGNAQALYTNLVKLMEGGMSARTSCNRLELELGRLRLDKGWNKPIVSFLVHFSHKLNDLRELRDPSDTTSYGDTWAISAIDTCLSSHSKMASHVNSLASTCNAIATMGASVSALTFDAYMEQLTSHATVLDSRYQARHRATNLTDRGQPNQGGRGGGQGGRGGRGGDSSKPSGDVTDPTVRLSDAQYQKLTPEQRKKRFDRKQAASSQRTTNRTTTVPGTTTTTPPLPAVTVPLGNARTVASTIANSVPPVPPGTVLRQIMSSASARDASAPTHDSDSVTINGATYCRVNHALRLCYRIFDSTLSTSVPGALVDGGANGGLISPSDAVVLETDLIATVDVVGITSEVMESLPIVQAAAVVDTLHDGPIIGIFSHYALCSDGGRTIHSKGQLQSYDLLVDDTAASVGGSQNVVTNEGYVIPLHVRDGLPYMDMSPPTDAQMDSLPHVFFTAGSPWDPSSLDGEYPDTPEAVLPPAAIACRDDRDPHVTDTGWVVHSSTSQRWSCHSSPVDQIVQTLSPFATTVFLTAAASISAFPQSIHPRLPDLDVLRPNFGWVPVDRIKDTLDATT